MDFKLLFVLALNIVFSSCVRTTEFSPEVVDSSIIYDESEGMECVTLDINNDTQAHWKISEGHNGPPQLPWLIYLDYATCRDKNDTCMDNVTSSFWEHVGLEAEKLGEDWNGAWIALDYEGGDPPRTHEPYPKIRYSQIAQITDFKYIQIQYFIHGDAEIWVNTTTGRNPLKVISKNPNNSPSEKWNTTCISLEDRKFEAVELRALGKENGAVAIDKIDLCKEITTTTTSTTTTTTTIHPPTASTNDATPSKLTTARFQDPSNGDTSNSIKRVSSSFAVILCSMISLHMKKELCKGL